MCQRCGIITATDPLELQIEGGGEPIRICPACLSETALFATEDDQILPFMREMVRLGRGQLGWRARTCYLIRSATLLAMHRRPKQAHA